MEARGKDGEKVWQKRGRGKIRFGLCAAARIVQPSFLALPVPIR